MRIGVARLWHEANSFAVNLTGMNEFRLREWAHGDEARRLYLGTATEIGGALGWAADSGDVELVFSRCASAPPGGPVAQIVLDGFIDEVVSEPNWEEIDGIYLSLHGACIGTGDEDPEATLLAGLRQRFPEIPIVASFDMHACLSQSLVSALNAVTVYRTYPHIDMDESACRALDMLAQMIATGRRSHVTLKTIDRVLPSFNMRTDEQGPMFKAEQIALDREQNAPLGQIFAAYPFGSFAYADVDATNAGAVVTSEDPVMGQAAAASIADFLFEHRGSFRPLLPQAQVCLASRPWSGARRVAILEPSDNPLSGGQGDTPGLFAAALASDMPEGTVFAFFCDPATVDTAFQAGEGATLSLELGGKYDARYGAGVPCVAEVMRLTDGHFRNAGPMERGMSVALGRTVVLKVGPLRVIVTTGCQSPNDINYFHLHRISLDDVPVLLAKAKNHFMAAFKGVFDEVLLCETRGPAMADISQLPFRVLPQSRLCLD